MRVSGRRPSQGGAPLAKEVMERGHRLFRAVGVVRGGSWVGLGRVVEGVGSLHEKFQSGTLTTIERNCNLQYIKALDQNSLHT